MNTYHWLALILSILGTCFAIVYEIAKRAPEGYEDESGFHLGRPK